MFCPEEGNELLAQFPDVSFAFAYGSGAVLQGGYNYSKDGQDLPMVDLILAVDDPLQWHTDNMKRNANHYTSLIPLNAWGVAMVQERIKANFWFNPYIPAGLSKQPKRLMKYGVISTKHLLRDLMSWNSLYAAGRLHKPVHIIKHNPAIEAALAQNRQQAIGVSLLLLPERFSEVELFMTVASLSYVGDPRMLVGENPKKVENLVTPIVDHYQHLYDVNLEQRMASQQLQRFEANGRCYWQDKSRHARWMECLQLPSTLRALLGLRSRQIFSQRSIKSRSMVPRPPHAVSIRTALAAIVASAATMQTMKGLFTAGLFKSTDYAWAKVKKRFAF